LRAGGLPNQCNSMITGNDKILHTNVHNIYIRD